MDLLEPVGCIGVDDVLGSQLPREVHPVLDSDHRDDRRTRYLALMIVPNPMNPTPATSTTSPGPTFVSFMPVHVQPHEQPAAAA